MIDVVYAAVENVPVVISYKWTAGEISIVLASLTITVVTIIGAWASSRRRTEAKAESEVIVKKAEQADEKLDHIKELTNSTLTTAMKKINDLTAQNDRLEKMLDRLLQNGNAREMTRVVIEETKPTSIEPKG